MTGLEKVVYKAFGLRVTSNIPLPELPVDDKEDGKIDVVVEIADLSKQWEELVSRQKKFMVEKDLFLFQVPNCATFLIQNGEKILVTPMAESDEDEVRLFILGTCMGTILMQRKVLPLHGSAVAIDGKAYVFVGDSGAGKSTLASVFLKRGYRLLSDDLIGVTFSHDNIPHVTPSYPQQKLWQETLAEFGMETNQYRPIYQRETKFAVPVSSSFLTEQLPLGGVFELVKTDSDQIEIHDIPSLVRLQTLLLHTYRNFLVPHSGLTEWHFKTTVNVVSKINLFQLRRPKSGFTADQLASVILTALKKEA